MDQSSFDRIARLLGGATTRRAGLRAALAGALGIALADPAGAAKNAGKGTGDGGGASHGKTRGRDRVKPEGPCGNGSKKDNACTKGSDCCTGLCNTKLGKKNKDRKGRCRCVRRGSACTADKNCCNDMTCANGTCGGSSEPPIPTGDPCTEGGTACEDPNASCTSFDAGSGGASGTYCLLPILGKTCAKAGDCTVNSCFGGTCITCSCGGCPNADADACASPIVTSGGSVQTAIDNAADGDTITIGPGTYVEDLTYSGKTLTFLGCPDGANEVILKNATTSVRTIEVTDASNFTMLDIVIMGNNDIANTIGGGGIRTNGGSVCIGMRSRIVGCASFGTEGGGLFVDSNTNKNQTLAITDAVVFDGNVTDTYGGGIYADDKTATLINGHARFINNRGNYGGAIASYFGATLTVLGHVEMTDNTADSYGGAIYFYGGGLSTPGVLATLGGNLLVARNTAPNGGGGIAVQYSSEDETVFIEGDVVIDNNSTDTYGGGVYCGYANLTIRGNAKITNNKTTKDDSAYGGGGVFHSKKFTDTAPALTIEENAEISGNTSAGQGGGMYVSDTQTVTIGGAATIKNNTASHDGGGIWIDATSPTIAITGTASITGNTAVNGGGIYDEDGSATVTGGSAVTGNTPDNCDGNGGLTC